AFGFTQECTLHCRTLSQLPSGGACPRPLPLILLLLFYLRAGPSSPVPLIFLSSMPPLLLFSNHTDVVSQT
ncbi:hypothetical protein DFH06DRAFT_1221269, partial [Mycena polygramma]